MLTAFYILLVILLYIVLWFKGNANKIYTLDIKPWEWWLYTGLVTNYLGLLSWWYFLEKYGIWGALAITYILHTVVELGLSFYFFDSPTNTQYIGLLLLTMGSMMVLK
jgi:uncharacterized membrane protein